MKTFFVLSRKLYFFDFFSHFSVSDMKEPRVFSLTERHAMGTSNHVDLFVNVAGHSRKCRMKTSPQTLLTGKNLVAFLKEVFLPQRYPDSVSSDYFEYQVSHLILTTDYSGSRLNGTRV